MNNHLTLKTLQIKGPDASAFLQGMLTCNVEKLEPNKPISGAACNRKGRVIANFLITKQMKGEHIAFDIQLPESVAALLIQHLKKYVIASKVTITETNETESVDLLEAIKHNTPYIIESTSGLFTPQMISLEKLGAVDFKKGCYLGQEIVARTEHLGKLKRHLHQLTLPLNEMKAPGDEITVNETTGIVVNAAKDDKQCYILAVLKDT